MLCVCDLRVTRFIPYHCEARQFAFFDISVMVTSCLYISSFIMFFAFIFLLDNVGTKVGVIISMDL